MVQLVSPPALDRRNNPRFDIYSLITKKQKTNTDAAKRPQQGHMLVLHTGGAHVRYERR